MLDREADQKEAMEAAGPILPVVYKILDDAVSFYFSKEYSDAARADHTERATANCIYSHAEKKMLSVAEAAPGLSLIKVGGMYVLNYRDKVLFRCKKVKPNGRHSNYQTEQQRDYDDQKTLPGIPEPAFRLTAGYLLDAAGSALERIMIAKPIGRSVFWSAQVSFADDAAQWTDITPPRFTGTEGSDFNAAEARRRRG